MKNLSDINVIRSVMAKHGVTFNKGLGQNFLVDPLCILLYQPLRPPIQKQHQQVEHYEEDEVHDIILRPSFRVVGQCVGDIKM